MSEVRDDLRYIKSHEWIRIEDDVATIGITDFAQSQLGDLVHIELPEVDRVLSVDDECAVVESVKSASDVYSPVAGTVIAINEDLNDTPEMINNEPYDAGWLFQIKLNDDNNGVEDLLAADEYAAIIADEE